MSSKTHERLGGYRGPEQTRFDAEKILTPIDKGHFMYGKVPAARYAEDAPEMKWLVGVIHEEGPQTVVVRCDSDRPGEPQGLGGNRTIIATRIVNRERAKDKLPPFVPACDVRKDITDARAVELFGRLNERQEPNDWMTRIGGAAQQVECGVLPTVAAEEWGFPNHRILMRAITKPGILTAHKDVKAALAAGTIKLKRALQIADLPLSEQVAAMEGKREKIAKMAATVSLTRLAKVREALRDDKRLDGMTAAELLDVLCGSAVVNEASLVVGQIIVAKGKPGRKPTQPTKQDGLTDEEREETKRFLDAEAKKREEEEAEKRK